MRFKRFIVVLLLLTMVFSSAMPAFASGAEKVELKDTGNSYAKKEIDDLVDTGIISGYADGTFQPLKAMTRAELAKILVLSLGVKEDPAKANDFLDVAENSWYRGYVGALVTSGITQGTSLTTFSPEANVTRQELVVFFIRALGLEELAAKLPVTHAFSDKDQIADWAKNQVSLAARIGFVQGTEGADGTLLFNPNDKAERQALARLAYEFKTNASQYVEKAKELANGQKGSIVTSIEAVSNTSIEVTFPSELASVSKNDFVFDHDLQVVEAAFKAGSKSVVVLTTSAQTKDVSYQLTFKGISIGKSVLGVAATGFFGGGGGGGVSVPSVEQQLASGTAQDTITVKASGTYGPVSGPATTVQKLIIDPGPSGEVTLRNINPAQLEVLSGNVSSIKLQNTVVKQLKVNAVNNKSQNVRIEAQSGASVEDTEVSSQAILESSSKQGTLGKIRLSSAAAGKQVTLKGNIDGDVTVEAPGVRINLDLPSGGNSLPTVVKSLVLKSNAEITAAEGTVTEGVNVASPNLTLKVDGPVEINRVEIPSGSTGTIIQIGASAIIKQVITDTIVAVEGDPRAIAKVSSENGALQMSDGLKTQVKAEAILLANQAIDQFFYNNTDLTTLLAKIENADRAIAIAKKYGAFDADFGRLSSYKDWRQIALDLRDDVNGPKGAIVTSIEAISNNSIEVTFLLELASVSKNDFVFDHGLQVVEAAFKAGSKSIVVLTTSAQTKDVSYQLTFKGISIDKSVLGAGQSVEQQLASGTAQDTITVKASGTYGPVSGPATTVQKLIIDPGPSGEVTLRNINSAQLEVLSGNVSSIKLQNTVVKQLKVNAVNNKGQNVRIEAQSGASVEDTEVSSQAILESSSKQGTLGKIRLSSAAAGKQVTLKGKIDGDVTVEAPGVRINLDPPSGGNLLPTVVKSLVLKSNAEITAAKGTVTEGVNVASPNLTLKVDGPGEINRVEMPSGLTGTIIQVGASANIKTVNAAANVAVEGDPGAIAKVSSENGALQMSDELKTQVKAKAILLANQAISQFIGDRTDFATKFVNIENADRAIAIAKKYEALDSDLYNLSFYNDWRQIALDLRDAANALQLQYQPGDTASSVTKDIIFPSLSGTVVTWSSDRPDLVSSWSPLGRPASGEGDATVTITAVLYKGAFITTKTFVVKVKQYDSKVVAVESLRSDLVLVSFDYPVVNSRVTDFRIDHDLNVINVTQYPYLKNYVLLTVDKQTKDMNYQVTYKQQNTNVSFAGSTVNKCSDTVCPLPYPSLIKAIPLPGVNVPGFIQGMVQEQTENGLLSIQNAKVELIGTDRSVLTNADGVFNFDQVPPGISYKIRVSKDKYSEAQSAEFALLSGEPYWGGMFLLHTAPKPVIKLNTLVMSSRVYLSWEPASWTMNESYYEVYINDRKIESPYGQTSMIIDTLQENQAYTIAVKACNDVGCAAPTTISLQMPLLLHIDQIKPYNSVTKQVYAPLVVDAEISEYRFLLPKASSSADYLLLSLKDSDYVPGTGTGLLKGTLDISGAEIGLVAAPTGVTVTGTTEIIEGKTYYKISFYNQPVPYINANLYNIYGLKYVLNGQILQVGGFDFAIIFE